jgi:hypothetical protein
MSEASRSLDAMAYGQYEIPLPGGGSASAAFSLGRPQSGTDAATLSSQGETDAHGRVSLVGYPGALATHSAAWVRIGGSVHFTVREDAPVSAHELHRMLTPYLARFLLDVAPIAALVGALPTKSSASGDGDAA